MKKLIKLLSSRLFWFILLMALQFVFLIVAVIYVSNNIYVFLCLLAATVLTALFVVTRDESPEYRMAWLLILIVFSLAGSVLYLIFGNKKIGKRSGRKIIHTHDLEHLDGSDEAILDNVEGNATDDGRQMAYIHRTSGYAPWKDSQAKYYAFCDDFVEDLVTEIRKARKFIFIEYFILAPGKVWDRILAELRMKREEGVDIRIMYDDLGSISVLPINYAQKLRSMGFEAYAFNPVALHLNPRLNYRDHRKIFNIDGNVCFSGGLNLADEYNNNTIRFGYWKDNAIKITGAAVWNFTQMFLQIWRQLSHTNENINYFRPTIKVEGDGYIQPFADSPFDETTIARNVYIQAINNAKRYVWIITPYLILDSEMVTALSIAAGSGVDVRIVCPRIPDKKVVHMVSRSFYQRLVSQGIRIYEFAPGFIHSKTLVIDDRVALVGTANMDYRSFYLHFELSVLFSQGDIIESVKKDTLYAIERGVEMELEDLQKVGFFRRIVRTFFGFFAPAL